MTIVRLLISDGSWLVFRTTEKATLALPERTEMPSAVPVGSEVGLESQTTRHFPSKTTGSVSFCALARLASHRAPSSAANITVPRVSTPRELLCRHFTSSLARHTPADLTHFSTSSFPARKSNLPLLEVRIKLDVQFFIFFCFVLMVLYLFSTPISWFRSFYLFLLLFSPHAVARPSCSRRAPERIARAPSLLARSIIDMWDIRGEARGGSTALFCCPALLPPPPLVFSSRRQISLRAPPRSSSGSVQTRPCS